jgi:hypothetical protein
MRKSITFTVSASMAAFALAACSSEPEPAERDMAGPMGATTELAPVTPWLDVTLDPEQQARYDVMDREAIRVEYNENAAEMMEETDSGDATSGDAASGSTDGAASGSGVSMPSPSMMTFDYLDRNKDGKLSVAEYAIWAMPVSPAHQAPNDQGAPELTSEQINDVGRSFFYFDGDGSTYLSPTELAAARSYTGAPAT